MPLLDAFDVNVERAQLLKSRRMCLVYGLSGESRMIVSST